MKLFAVLILCGAVVSCDLTLPSQRVAEAAIRYDKIRMNMSSNEVYRLLGLPQYVDTAGFQHWRTDGISTNNYAELIAGFNSDGKIWSLGSSSALK